MKNHAVKHILHSRGTSFFTTVEKAYHSRAHMINPKASQDKPPCKNTTEAYVAHNGSLCKRQESPVRCAKNRFYPPG